MSAKTGVLLIQLGTPDSPGVGDVRKYLFEFLNDPRVIDIPWLLRKILVNLIIVPFRAPKSAKIYKQLWTENGSPLLIYSESLKEKLQKKLGDDFEIELAMRYKNPSLDDVLSRMREKNYGKIVVFPLFPQYASASTGSALEKVMEIVKKWTVIPEIKFISEFHDDEFYINTVAARGAKYNINDYDHVLFSYHGLPTRQLNNVHSKNYKCDMLNCGPISEGNKYCYRAQCFSTTKLIADKLNIPSEKYTVSFQSRLDKKWLEPFSDKIVIQKAKEGAKKLLVFSPAFVADCLETTIEIGDEYNILFREHGGEKVQLVESLNDNDDWVNAVESIIKKNI
ncbi:MAG: ferrochelatase [Bacteroidetes bacterium]|nr:ferrochelatase [Bacteroidota bacterium]